MLYCLELRDLLVGQLSMPYFLYLKYAHTSLSLSSSSHTKRKKEKKKRKKKKEKRKRKKKKEKKKKQSSLRTFAAGRVSNQLPVSHERSGRAKCIPDSQGQALVVFSITRFPPALLPHLYNVLNILHKCVSSSAHSVSPSPDRLSQLQLNVVGSVGTLPAVCDTFCL